MHEPEKRNNQPHNNKDEGNNTGEGSDANGQQNNSRQDAKSSHQQSEQQDLGAEVISVRYGACFTRNEEESILSAGTVTLHENGITHNEQLGDSMLRILGATDEESALKALRDEDGGSPSVRVGSTEAYRRGWQNLWGNNSN